MKSEGCLTGESLFVGRVWSLRSSWSFNCLGGAHPHCGEQSALPKGHWLKCSCHPKTLSPWTCEINHPTICCFFVFFQWTFFLHYQMVGREVVTGNPFLTTVDGRREASWGQKGFQFPENTGGNCVIIYAKRKWESRDSLPGVCKWQMPTLLFQLTTRMLFGRLVVSDSATPWTAACQASLSITNSRSLLKLMSIKSVMPSNHLILCRPLSSCHQSLPASGSFQMSQLFASGGQRIGVSAPTSVLPMNIQDWSPLGWTGWISLQSKGLSRIFSNTTVQTHLFFSAQLSLQSNPQLSHPYMTTGKTIALTRWTFLDKVMSLLLKSADVECFILMKSSLWGAEGVPGGVFTLELAVSGFSLMLIWCMWVLIVFSI